MKIFLSALFILLITIVVIYLVGPKPTTPLYKVKLPIIPELVALPTYVASQEAKHKIKPGNEAEIVWADSTRQQTEYAIVYLHGFSASKQEGNPAYTYLAKALHANLYLARLADHGIDTVAPMQYFTADRLWETGKEAYAIGKKLGKKVILVGTSTGGSLALQLAATYPEINSLVLMSPNIAINDNKAWLLNNPWGLQIARKVTGGNERTVDGRSPEYKKYWYTHYRLESVVQLEEMLESSMTTSLFKKVKQPVLLLYYYKNDAEQDPVVKVDAMLKMFDELGTPVRDKQKIAIPNAGNHVIGSSITSKDIEGVEHAMDDFIKARKSTH
ncbi:alpha/beta hydrolase [Pedobacter boryungensis]|uniref:Alpha/beta fold hydrolase n=1 Tax=Pedobacter boryungensis TaxID=869962 RepID=A0ABX2DFP2_9SPHI|nr:alpha/beta fold hydrolase [Pedobacter boryungensis]NQX32106.1 alpha/beta fold hydrolase [Pedobacter boryungensis]